MLLNTGSRMEGRCVTCKQFVERRVLQEGEHYWCSKCGGEDVRIEKSLLERAWNRLFPIHTHCLVCGIELHEPSRMMYRCPSCDAW
jgi:Zn finger protein HypA/HybF involved in hydrogenase expression